MKLNNTKYMILDYRNSKHCYFTLDKILLLYFIKGTVLQCVIGVGHIAVPVMIKDHKIISCLSVVQLTQPLKLILITFQVKDNMIYLETFNTIEIDGDA